MFPLSPGRSTRSKTAPPSQGVDAAGALRDQVVDWIEGIGTIRQDVIAAS